MTFTIDKVYKAGVPRGEFYRTPVTSLGSSSTTPLTVSPSTTPSNWAVLLDTLKILEASFATSGAGDGMFQIQYPDYVGISIATFLVNSVDELKQYADKVLEYNSATYYVFEFKPPILIRASNTVSQATFGTPSDVVIDSGSLNFHATGWTIKEDDYD